MNYLLTLVERFATALDTDDYATAALCLERDALFDDDGRDTIYGRDRILESFKQASEWGRSNLDSLRFLHKIDEATPLEIRLIDVLAHDGEEMMLNHTMHVSLSDRGLIAELRLVYPPGERERLRDFFTRHRLRR